MHQPQSTNRIIECDVCFEDYNAEDKKPRILSTCGHSFCTACLQEIAKDKSVRCPTCRQNTSLPRGDVSKLPTDFTALKLLDSLCLECKTVPWVTKCENCSKRLCERCQSAHGKSAEVVSALRKLDTKMQEVEKKSKLTAANNLDKVDFKFDVLASHITEFQQKVVQKYFESSFCREIGQVLDEHTRKMVAKTLSVSTRNKQLVEKWSRRVSSRLHSAKRFSKNAAKLVVGKCDTELPRRTAISVMKNCEKLTDILNQVSNISIVNHDERVECNVPTHMWENNFEFTGQRSAHMRLFFNEFLVYNGPCHLYSTWISFAVSPRTENIAVLDHNATRIQLLDRNFHFIRYIGDLTPGIGLSLLWKPVCVAINSSGEIFVSDQGNNRILAFTEDGRLSPRPWCMYMYERSGVVLNRPTGIAVNKKGLLFICDSGNQRILVVTREGLCLTEVSNFYWQPEQIVIIDESWFWPGTYLLVTLANRMPRLLHFNGEKLLFTSPMSIDAELLKDDTRGIARKESGTVMIQSVFRAVRLERSLASGAVRLLPNRSWLKNCMSSVKYCFLSIAQVFSSPRPRSGRL